MTTLENARALTVNADTDHEESRDWYGAYGWHLSTDSGDVCLQAVEYDWLDDPEEAVTKLRRSHPDLTADEAESLVDRAVDVRTAAETVCGLLSDAVEAYEARDLERCLESLIAAERVEIEHGDAPATQSLASQLLSEGT